MPLGRILPPFIIGIVAVPAIILLHECGHYLAAMACGLEAHLSYNLVTITPLPDESRGIITVSGPLVELLLATGGIIVLWRLRSCRYTAAPTVSEWLATGCVFAAGRWLRCFTGTLSKPQPSDEAFISELLGLPSWVLPYALAPVSVGVLAFAISLHPKGMRLVPFSMAIAAGLFSLLLWFTAFGPLLLPRP